MKKNWILAAALACASSMGAAITVNADEAYRVYSVSDARTAKSVSQAIQDESASDMMAMPATAPAGAALAPPGYYMMFLIDDKGVPSVAKMVKLG